MFYIFWELTLIPMFYIIGFWGAEKRFYAAMKFFLYTFIGSLIMLVGILYFGYVFFETTGTWSFSLLDWNSVILPFDLQLWLFIAFFFGFAVKVPMFPFHTWLPLAHLQAPTIGSVILAAVLLKMETYGFIRFSFTIIPRCKCILCRIYGSSWINAIIYGNVSLCPRRYETNDCLLFNFTHGCNYSWVFALNVEGIAGAVYLMIGHGIVSGALFMSVGYYMIEEKLR